MFIIYPVRFRVHFHTTVPAEDSQAQINSTYKPCLHVELENENPLSVKGMKISGKNKTSHIN